MDVEDERQHKKVVPEEKFFFSVCAEPETNNCTRYDAVAQRHRKTCLHLTEGTEEIHKSSNRGTELIQWAKGYLE